MTIAFGILATDGIVLAADTEEISGYAGGLKTDSQKILTGMCAGKKQTGVAISGAGTANYIDSISPKMLSTVTNATQNPDVSYDTLQDAIESQLADFYSKHVIPFANFPDHERPDFCLLIGVEHGSHSGIWSTDRTTVYRCMPFGAVGVGSTYAKILLARLVKKVDLMKASIVAAYVAFKVKQTIEGCGRDTDIVLVRRGGTTSYIHSQDILKMEQFFQEYELIERKVFHYALAIEPAGDIDKILSRLNSLRTGLSTDTRV
jgi:20S proteasome alpha/beta subunit